MGGRLPVNLWRRSFSPLGSCRKAGRKSKEIAEGGKLETANWARSSGSNSGDDDQWNQMVASTQAQEKSPQAPGQGGGKPGYF